MAYTRVNQDIHFSPFEIVYGYRPDTVSSSQGLKLIKSPQVLKENLSEKLINIQEAAAKQAKERESKQQIFN